MNDSLAQRVRSAAVAAWWTILIAAIWLTVGWLIWLAILSAQPSWLLTLWGRKDMSWEEVHRFVITFLVVFKMILFVCVLLAIWLSLWGQRLKRSAAA